MLTYLRHKRGQSTLEYAVLIIIIIAALLSIQVYIKRGVQGKLKSSADDIGDQYSVGNTNVVKRTVTISNTTDTFGLSRTNDTTAEQGVSVSKLRADEKTNTTERSVILQQDQEYWGK